MPCELPNLKMRRSWPAAICLVCLLASAGCNYSRSNASQTETPVGGRLPRTNLPLPPAERPEGATTSGWTLLDNRHAQISDYLGQVVVLDFWATYCPPCLEEVPHLVSLQARYGPQGLQVIGLNVGGSDDEAKVPAFVEEFRVQYAVGFPDPGTTDFYLGSDETIPQTLVFDRHGKLVKHFVGFDAQVSAELERTIQTALNGGID